MEGLKLFIVSILVISVSAGGTYYLYNEVQEYKESKTITPQENKKVTKRENQIKEKTSKQKELKVTKEEVEQERLAKKNDKNLESFLSQTYDNIINVHNQKQAANQIINKVYNEYDKTFEFTNDKTRFNFIVYPNKDILIVKIETTKKNKIEQYKKFLHNIKKKFERVEEPIQLSIGINNEIKKILKKDPNRGLSLMEQEIKEIKRRKKEEEYIEEKKKRYTNS